MNDKYCFDIPDEGTSPHNILDYCFNKSTEDFLLKSGLMPGMNVLELGCGAGSMSCWIAQRIGPKGHLVAIDNDPAQLSRAQIHAEQNDIHNLSFACQDADDISKREAQFDLVYCRFILHHLERPRDVIAQMISLLKPGGIIAIEEGIVNHAFVYPHQESFGNERFTITDHHINTEGQQRDGNFGIKLYHTLHRAGISDLSLNLVAPVLTTRDEKSLLLSGHQYSKRSQIEHGVTEEQWQHRLNEMKQFIIDDSVIVGFYQSAQVHGVKSKKQ